MHCSIDSCKQSPEQVLEVGVEPAVEDGVRDGGEHGKGVHDEEQGQLEGRFDRRLV